MKKISMIVLMALAVLCHAGAKVMEFHDVHGVCVSPAGVIITIENEGEGLVFKSASVDAPSDKMTLELSVPETATRESDVQVGEGNEFLLKTFTSHIFDMTLSSEGDYLGVITYTRDDGMIVPDVLYVYGLYGDELLKSIDLKTGGVDFSRMWFLGRGRILFSGRGRTCIYDLKSGKSEDLPGEGRTVAMQYLAAEDMLLYMGEKDDASDEPGIFVRSPLMSGERIFIGEFKDVTETSEGENFKGSFSYDVPVITHEGYKWIIERGMENIKLSGLVECYSYFPEMYKKISESFPMCGRFTFVLFGDGRFVLLYDSFTNTMHIVER